MPDYTRASGQLLLDDVPNVLKYRRLVPDFLGKLVAKPFEVDLAEIEGQALRLITTGHLCANRLIHDPVQFLEQFGHVRRVPAFGQFFVDRFNIVVPLGIGEYSRLHKQGLESDENLSRQYLEPSLGLVARIDRLDRIGKPFDTGEALHADQRHGIETKAAQMRLGRLDGFYEGLYAFLNGCDDLLVARLLVAERVLGERSLRLLSMPL